ncbi:hypothetical protein [Chryseobacterium sp.]|uniref:hypothetical protein n=1 Tax=Chryseobacterium sp. TaxID=1871047 RepID=UPI0024E1BF38|nr:hypothetical protein [Chryseobacterium sp.]
MEQYFLENRELSINGICFKKEKFLTGIIFNPVDYVIDGMKFINSGKIKNVVAETDEFKDKIMTKKFQKYFDDANKKILKTTEIKDFQSLFNAINSMDILCELSLNKEDVVYIGKVINVYDDSIDIDFFNTECKLIDNAFVEFEDITTVSIFSDYLDTLSEVMKDDVDK